jgi:hypothetical protein
MLKTKENGLIHGWGSGKRTIGLLWGYFLQITFI